MNAAILSPVRPLLTTAVFATTLVLLLRRPFKLNEAWATAFGALFMLLLGLETWDQALATLMQGKDVLLFLLFLMSLSALIDQTGFFEWAAIRAAAAAKGDGRRLFRNVFLVGAVITALFSLDTTAIILTPIVMSFIKRLRLEAKPFLIGCAFVSNTGSLLLPVSNLTNLLFQNAFQMPFISFTLHMLCPQVAVVWLNYWLLSMLFRNSLPQSYADDLPPAESVIPDKVFFLGACVVLLLVLLGYFMVARFHVPVYAVAAAGSLVLLACGTWRRQLEFHKLGQEISWSLFPFVIGLFIVMRGVENIGLDKELASWLQLVGSNPFLRITANAFAAAIGSNVINNIPMALLSISVLKESSSFASTGMASQLGALLGCNLGPNITIMGSLATMLVIQSARKRGADVRPLEFFKAGAMVTPALLLAASIALWGTCMLLDSPN